MSKKESVENLQLDLEAHKLTSQKSYKYYIEMVNRCATQWKRIAGLQGKESLSDEEEEEHSRLQEVFSLTLSADYQMSKLVPSWDMSPQPGSTYYLQKVSHNIFEVDDHSTNSQKSTFSMNGSVPRTQITQYCISITICQLFHPGLNYCTSFR